MTHRQRSIVVNESSTTAAAGTAALIAGTVEAKDALRVSGLPTVSNVSEKGGPAVAAAVFDALLRAVRGEEPEMSR